MSAAVRETIPFAVAGDNSLKGEALDTMSVLRAEAARGTCVVVSLHDLGLAARFADRVIVLAGGRVAADGPPDEALRPAIIDAAYGVGFRTVILEGVTQPVAWSRRP